MVRIRAIYQSYFIDNMNKSYKIIEELNLSENCKCGTMVLIVGLMNHRNNGASECRKNQTGGKK